MKKTKVSLLTVAIFIITILSSNQDNIIVWKKVQLPERIFTDRSVSISTTDNTILSVTFHSPSNKKENTIHYKMPNFEVINKPLNRKPIKKKRAISKLRARLDNKMGTVIFNYKNRDIQTIPLHYTNKSFALTETDQMYIFAKLLYARQHKGHKVSEISLYTVSKKQFID